jgi:hypothetical protein
MSIKQGTYFQHRYGGIYTVVDSDATSTVDLSRLVVYKHVFPFEQKCWVRPYSEFSDGRFRELDATELSNLLSKDRAQAQVDISEARKIAKG